MYKHQVIAIRRTDSWRSRNSPEPGHIVGICTLEAVHENDERPDEWEFENFDPNEEWVARNGKVQINPQVIEHGDDLTVRCRHWTLEEVTSALKESTPQHRFYVRGAGGTNNVFSYRGKTDLYTIVGGARVPVYSRGLNQLCTIGAGGAWVPFDINVDDLYHWDPNEKWDPTQMTKDPVFLNNKELCVLRGGMPRTLECRSGSVRWIRTNGGSPTLYEQSSHPESIVCDVVNRCPLIPRSAHPVVRGHEADC